MKMMKWGMVAGLAASVSMVAACNLSKPVTQAPTEGTIGSGVKPGATGNVGGNVGTPTGTMTQAGDATIRGKVLDKDGNPVAGATVMSGSSQTLTAADGSYTLKIVSGEAVNIKVLKDGYVLRDSILPVSKGEMLEINSSLVKADANITSINAATGGKAVSSDGKTELIFPAGALKGNADVRVTWLNPVESASAPAAFKVAQVGDAGPVGGTADATPAAAPAPSITALNTTDLPGPLETKAYGDRKFFSPVSFAAITMTNNLKEGESATLRMEISAQVLADMRAAGDLKDSDLGQDIFPCFSWSADESTWDKPALSKVVKDEKGKYWFEYTVRASSLSPAVAKYQTLQVGDTQGSARVELQVGGGRRVVDGTFTYGALIERSSSDAYDFKGFSNKTMGSGQYHSPSVSNLIRPNVSTTNYTGTVYGQTMGTAEFSEWDREGMFRLAFPPGAKYQISGPAIFGLAPADNVRTGTTATAAQAYLLPDPTRNAVQTQSIQATYVKPFYYYTDGTVTVTLEGVSSESANAAYTFNYTVDNVAKSADVTASNNKVTFKLPRNAAGSAQAFKVKSIIGTSFSSGDGQTPSGNLPVGGSLALTVKMFANGAK